MKRSNLSFDWVGFLVNFSCGAALGACIGLYLWIRSDWARSTTATPGIYLVIGLGLAGGIMAGTFRDEFWVGLPKAYCDRGALWLKVLAVAGILALVIWLIMR